MLGRSGYMLQEGQAVEFAESVERMLQQSLGLPADAQPEDEPEDEAEPAPRDADDEAEAEPADDHDEL